MRVLRWPACPADFPKDVGNSARQARQSKSTGDFARQMCEIIASPSVQSTREFRDVEGVKLWPMFENIARAAYIYSDDVVQVWGEVFATCNKMGGKAAEGVGYGTAFIFSEGLVEVSWLWLGTECRRGKKWSSLLLEHSNRDSHRTEIKKPFVHDRPERVCGLATEVAECCLGPPHLCQPQCSQWAARAGSLMSPGTLAFEKESR